MVICTQLDPRFKTFTFLGATDEEKVWANQVLKGTFEDKWSTMPLAPVPAAAAATATATGVDPAAVADAVAGAVAAMGHTAPPHCPCCCCSP